MPCLTTPSNQINVAVDYFVAVSYIECVKSITYTRSAIKTLRRMPANTAKRIVAKVEEYAANPAALANNVTALKGRTGIRMRVGDWRVIMDDGVVLAVLEIGPRGGIYD